VNARSSTLYGCTGRLLPSTLNVSSATVTCGAYPTLLVGFRLGLFRRRPRALSVNRKKVNRNHARDRAPGERTVAAVKTWNTTKTSQPVRLTGTGEG
jgi:hypothetical protein